LNAGRLLADIGGTNARFARVDLNGNAGARVAYEVADYATFADAVAAYLAETGNLGLPESAAVAAAGPVRGARVKLTNADWVIDRAALAAQLGGVPVGLFNDLEAVALALPYLAEDDVAPIGSLAADATSSLRRLAINVGTGFGAASVARTGSIWVASPSEAGHMSFGAADSDELAVIGDTPGGFTIENALSGDGLVELYRRQCWRLGAEIRADTAAAVLAAVPTEPAAAATLDLVTRWLGRVAQDLTLATAAWGGVYFCGSVAEHWAGLDVADGFRERFETNAKMGPLLAATPTVVIKRPDVALLGLARVAILEHT
jgi:glucokinase